jgi:hypothetical protein
MPQYKLSNTMVPTPEYHVPNSLVSCYQIFNMSHALHHMVPWFQHLAPWHWLFNKYQILQVTILSLQEKPSQSPASPFSFGTWYCTCLLAPTKLHVLMLS